MKSYLRCFDRKAELSLGRCLSGHGHCNALTPNARARGDAGRVMSRASWCVFARFSNYCCCRLIEDTLCLLTNGSALSGKKQSIGSDSSLGLYFITRLCTCYEHITIAKRVIKFHPGGSLKKELCNSGQGAHFSAFI